MNIWATLLADAPPTLQRLIARANRVSLPRTASADVRLARLRQALCHAATVRVTYFALPPDVQAALQHLRACRGGLSPDDLAARYGPLRAWSDLLADPQPRSLSERLILLGWLLPRPAAPRHPPRFLLPPEVRRWLPQPLRLADHGAAPPPPLAPAVHAARVLLLAAAERPLPLRQDGWLRVASQRLLVDRLAPLPDADAVALCRFVLPLLIDLGLLAPHGAAAALAPAGARFLAQDAAQQRARLHTAWVRAPRTDAWLRPLLVTDHGMDLPLLRRRLARWAAALPVERLLDPAALYAALGDAFGPLADAQTHGFRHVDRAPWQPKRAAAVWDAALRGPLTWLGLVAWAEADGASYCYATPVAAVDATDADDGRPTTDDRRPTTTEHGSTAKAHCDAAAAPAHWQYGTEPGELIVPHGALDAVVLRLLPAARWQAADSATTTYRITRRTLAAAQRTGQSASALAALLVRQAGPLPAAWQQLLVLAPQVRIVHAAVVLSDPPAVLTRAAEGRSVRRYLERQLAPGIALADPARVPALARALARHDLAVTVEGDPSAVAVAGLSAAESVLLLAATACYRERAPDGVSLDALAALEERLRAALPLPLQAAMAAAPPPARTAGGSFSADAVAIPAPVDAPPAVRPDGQEALAGADAVSETALAAAPPTRLPGRIAAFAPLLTIWVMLSMLLPTYRRARPYRVDRLPSRDDGTPEPATPAPAITAPSSRPDPAVLVAALRQAIGRRQAVELVYQAADDAPTTRLVRPLRLEGHGDRWYLHAYCTLRQAERVFRLDRISALTVLTRPLPSSRRPGRPPRVEAPPRQKSVGRARPYAPRAGFFAPPPAPSPGSPLVRVWLED